MADGRDAMVGAAGNPVGIRSRLGTVDDGAKSMSMATSRLRAGPVVDVDMWVEEEEEEDAPTCFVCYTRHRPKIGRLFRDVCRCRDKHVCAPCWRELRVYAAGLRGRGVRCGVCLTPWRIPVPWTVRVHKVFQTLVRLLFVVAWVLYTSGATDVVVTAYAIRPWRVVWGAVAAVYMVQCRWEAAYGTVGVVG